MVDCSRCMCVIGGRWRTRGRGDSGCGLLMKVGTDRVAYQERYMVRLCGDSLYASGSAILSCCQILVGVSFYKLVELMEFDECVC